MPRPTSARTSTTCWRAPSRGTRRSASTVRAPCSTRSSPWGRSALRCARSPTGSPEPRTRRCAHAWPSSGASSPSGAAVLAASVAFVAGRRALHAGGLAPARAARRRVGDLGVLAAIGLGEPRSPFPRTAGEPRGGAPRSAPLAHGAERLPCQRRSARHRDWSEPAPEDEPAPGADDGTGLLPRRAGTPARAPPRRARPSVPPPARASVRRRCLGDKQFKPECFR